jgi:hypothetical protein
MGAMQSGDDAVVDLRVPAGHHDDGRLVAVGRPGDLEHAIESKAAAAFGQAAGQFGHSEHRFCHEPRLCHRSDSVRAG